MVADQARTMGDFVPPGLGGGCVMTGPLKNITANLGQTGTNLHAPLMASDITPGA
jgi:tyrosinase